LVLLAEASAGLASSYSFVNPVIAMLLGVTLAGEHISRHEWLAAGIVLVGVVLLLTARGRSAKR
jgi:drug/metabolite transporter (DMT)-like permease